MVTLSQWQQTPAFDPTNPGQKIVEQYTGLPGGYSSFYFNPIPPTATLAGSPVGALAEAQGQTIGLIAGTVLGLGVVYYLAFMRKPKRKRT